GGAAVASGARARSSLEPSSHGSGGTRATRRRGPLVLGGGLAAEVHSAGGSPTRIASATPFARPSQGRSGMTTVPESLRTYRAALVAAVDRELEQATARRRHDRWRMPLVGAAVVAIAVLLALTIAAPWRGSPTLVERAEAALVPPRAGQVLYESIAVR